MPLNQRGGQSDLTYDYNRLNFASVRQLTDMLAGGEISVTALTEHFLHRLETLGPKYNAVVTVVRKQAMQAAAELQEQLRSSSSRSPIYGIPYGAKDLLATAGGIPTTWGARPLQNQILDEDAAVITALSDAGAVLIGKLSMVELAGMCYEQPDASFTGPGINPWNPKAWSGGSSSGCGSAIAARLVPFAIGSETCGSIICPSSFCGTTGLRPTFGRVNTRGAMVLCQSLDKLGPMARSADDCAIVFGAMKAEAVNAPQAVTTPRIGVLAGATTHCQPEVSANFERTVELLHDLGAISAVSVHDHNYVEVAQTILHAEAQRSFGSFIAAGLHKELTAPESATCAIVTKPISDEEYAAAQAARKAIVQDLMRLFEKVDVIVCPSTSAVASPLNVRFKDYNRPPDGAPPSPLKQLGAAGNLAGLPALSLPNGFGERGLPTGVCFTGSLNSEQLLLELGKRLQTITDWHLGHPADLAGLYAAERK